MRNPTTKKQIDTVSIFDEYNDSFVQYLLEKHSGCQGMQGKTRSEYTIHRLKFVYFDTSKLSIRQTQSKAPFVFTRAPALDPSSAGMTGLPIRPSTRLYIVHLALFSRKILPFFSFPLVILFRSLFFLSLFLWRRIQIPIHLDKAGNYKGRRMFSFSVDCSVLLFISLSFSGMHVAMCQVCRPAHVCSAFSDPVRTWARNCRTSSLQQYSRCTYYICLLYNIIGCDHREQRVECAQGDVRSFFGVRLFQGGKGANAEQQQQP